MKVTGSGLWEKMKTGDLVRFRCIKPSDSSRWKIGLLIDYKSWEKIARILCNDGTIVSKRPIEVQKYGGRGYKKKDRDEENDTKK